MIAGLNGNADTSPVIPFNRSPQTVPGGNDVANPDVPCGNNDEHDAMYRAMATGEQSGSGFSQQD